MAFLLSRHGRASSRRAWTAFVLTLLAAASASPQTPPASAKLEIKAVRFWSLGETTRVAIEVSAEFQYRHDRLLNPDRIYFDIVGAKSGFPNEIVHVIPVGDRLLRQIRVSQTQPEMRFPQ